MNIVFGTAGPTTKKNLDRIKGFEQYAKKHHKLGATTLTNTNSNVQLAYTSNDGKIIGLSKKNDVTLILYGFIYELPNWRNKKSPVDNPDITAAHLLSRYLAGDDFAKDTYGHFCVIIHDARKNTVLITRDPSGQNDLFYYHNGEEFVFSNKLRALAESLGNQLDLDRSYEDFFLIFGFYPAGRTMYKQVKAAPKKSILQYKNNTVTAAEVQNSKPKATKDIPDEKSLINNLYKELSSAMANIVPSNEKKVAVLLGGFDSALVAALLKQQGKQVETFSFYYEDQRFNQLHTETVADFLGIKHNWIKVDENTIKKGLKNFSHLFNQPTNWPSYVIQTAHLAKIIRERGFNYCYTGDGCDYLFYGYPITFKRAQVLSAIGTLPNFLLTTLIKLAERPLLERHIGRPYQVGLGALRSAKRNELERTYLTFRIFDELSLQQLRKNNIPKQETSIEQIVSDLVKQHHGMSPVRLAYEGKKEVSPNRNKLNGSADLSGLVIASPYMHHQVKAFAQSIPDELLRPEGSKIITGKYILSKMAEAKGLLPKEVIYQPKIGAADSPIEGWYNGPLQPTIYKLLDELPFAYNKKYVESLVKETGIEKLYSRLISKDTNNMVTLSHCISLLVTYAHFTGVDRQRR
jgi:asparagine synthase (glutamine-hydrolysing)